MIQLNLFTDTNPADPPGRYASFSRYTPEELEYLELQSYLPRWLQAHGWEIWKEVDTYRAALNPQRLYSYLVGTVHAAAEIAEHAAFFYATGPIPTGHKLPAGLPLFPEAYRTINGIRTPARIEYFKIWKPLHDANEKYLSR